MNRILDSESQQLVVLNGDLITGENTWFENSTHYIDRVVAPLVSRNLPWASTYGNHDSQYNLSGQALLAREQRFPNAKTIQMVSGEDNGATNYYLPVYSNNCTSHSACPPALLLWFFDSRGGFQPRQQYSNASDSDPIGRPNWVSPAVASWFRTTSSALHKAHNRTIPSLAFVHIPTHASLAFQSSSPGPDPRLNPGINDDVPLAAQADGWCADGSEGCSYGGNDQPFMDALAATPGLIAVFSGHDHGISWCQKWASPQNSYGGAGAGVNLCFGQRTGYGGYGSWARGSRQVLISEEGLAEGEVESWVRLERGEVVGRVGLNATFGRDAYEAVPDWRSRGVEEGYYLEGEEA